MAKTQKFQELTDRQCIDLARRIESLCDRLKLGNRLAFDSAGYALMYALAQQAANLRIVLEIIDAEKKEKHQ